MRLAAQRAALSAATRLVDLPAGFVNERFLGCTLRTKEIIPKGDNEVYPPYCRIYGLENRRLVGLRTYAVQNRRVSDIRHSYDYMGNLKATKTKAGIPRAAALG